MQHKLNVSQQKTKEYFQRFVAEADDAAWMKPERNKHHVHLQRTD